MKKKQNPAKPSYQPKGTLPTGRPPKYSDEDVIGKLCAVLAGGATMSAACKSADVSYRAVRNWILAAEAGDERYFHFVQRLKKAEADNEISLVAEIRAAASTQWQAAAWLLERRYHRKYGRKNNVAFQGDAVVRNGAIAPEQFVRMLSPDQLSQLVAAVETRTLELELELGKEDEK